MPTTNSLEVFKATVKLADSVTREGLGWRDVHIHIKIGFHANSYYIEWLFLPPAQAVT